MFIFEIIEFDLSAQMKFHKSKAEVITRMIQDDPASVLESPFLTLSCTRLDGG